MSDQTDTQYQERALKRAFDALMSLRPILLTMGGGLVTFGGAVWLLNHNWEAVKDDVKSQGQTLQVHENLIRAQGAEIQNIDVHFAKLEQMIIDLQNGRKTSLSSLPGEPLAGSAPGINDFAPLPGG